MIAKEQTQPGFQGVGGRNKIKEEKPILFFCRPYYGNVGGSVNQRKKKRVALGLHDIGKQNDIDIGVQYCGNDVTHDIYVFHA